jgi:S-sulfo-L-cysteine synthase (O-acetyl-L-serine-dependent)
MHTRRTDAVDRAARPGLLGLIGETPLLRLERITAHLAPGVSLYAKAEWFNPGGSVKDRPAAAILQRALDAGALGHGRTLLDSTSGNMGISYATLGTSLGLRVCLAVPANASPERLAILRAHGVELHLTDPTEGSDGARHVAADLARRDPERFFFADQYGNPANWQSHFHTTGPEILRQTQGRVSHFVAGLGTTGTMTGVGRFLREAVPDVRLIAVQPDGPIHGLEGLKHLPTALVPEIYDPRVPDETVVVDTESAYAMARRLARLEGLLVGVSAAAAADAALRVAERLETGTVVVIFPDSGLKYLGAAFWSAA